MGLKKGADVGDFFHSLLMPLFFGTLAVGLLFFYLLVTNKPGNINILANKIACVVHINCVKQQDFEQTSFRVYDDKVADYLAGNYSFYFTYPTTWQVSYRKNAEISKANKIRWDFKIDPIKSSSKDASDLSGSAQMYIEIDYPTYRDPDYYIENVLKIKPGDIVTEKKTVGGSVWYYFSKGPLNFSPHYMIAKWGGEILDGTYIIGFINTPKETEDKIIKYLLNYEFAHFF